MNEQNALNNEIAHNLMAAMLVPLIIAGLIGLLMLICQWIIYSKAGKPGWAILVPIYNFIVLLQIVGRPWYHMFFMLIPIYNIIFIIQVINGLSKSFGKDAGFTVGLIFLGFIFYPMLAFSKSIQYVGPGGVAAPAAQ
jgi:hypothetical protein